MEDNHVEKDLHVLVGNIWSEFIWLRIGKSGRLYREVTERSDPVNVIYYLPECPINLEGISGPIEQINLRFSDN
jgi:hypothetical protein